MQRVNKYSHKCSNDADGSDHVEDGDDPEEDEHPDGTILSINCHLRSATFPHAVFLWSSHRMAWIDAIMSTHLFLPRLCWRTRWWLRWSRRLLVWRTRRWGSIPTPWGFKWMWRGDKLAKISNKHEREKSNTLPLCPIVLIMVGLQRKNRKTQSNKLCPILTQDNDKEVNTPCRTAHGVVLKDPLWWNLLCWWCGGACFCVALSTTQSGGRGS